MTAEILSLNRERAMRDRPDDGPVTGRQATLRYKLLDLLEIYKDLGPEVLMSELTGCCVYVQAMKE